MTSGKKTIISIGATRIEADPQLAQQAGWSSSTLPDGTLAARDDTPYAYRRLAQALSEGRQGEHALLRAVAIGEEESRADRTARAEREIAQLRLEAARTEAQAARTLLDVEAAKRR